MRSAQEYLDGLRDGREVYYRGERVGDVVAHPELGLSARHGAIDFHGPSPDPSPYYTIPRSPTDLVARSELIEDSTRRGRTLVVLVKEIGTDALFALMRVLHGTDTTNAAVTAISRWPSPRPTSKATAARGRAARRIPTCTFASSTAVRTGSSCAAPRCTPPTQPTSTR